MKSAPAAGTFLPWIAVLSLLVAGAAMSARLAESAVASGSQIPSSIAEQLLGNSTKALAEYSYYKMADQFYHKGQDHYEETAFVDFFQRMKEKTAPAGIVHLKGNEMKESLAWMRMAMSLDPGNVEYAIVASYWLERELGRSDLAFQALDEAAALNPGSYLVHIGRGRLLAKTNRKAECRRAFETALKYWPGTSDPANEDVRMHRREILSYLAILAELDGDLGRAAAYLKATINMFPQKSEAVRKRLAQVENGGTPKESLLQTWNALLRENSYECDHGHEDHAGEHEHEDGNTHE